MEVEGCEMRFTGERVVPGVMDDARDLQAHLARYVAFMHPFCTHKIVLDAACGTGYGTQILSWAADSAFGIDIEPSAIEYAEEMYATDRTTFVIGDVTKMPFPDKMFDVVVSFETIEHLKEPEKFVDEAWRVLADDGVFIVSAPENSGSVFHRAEYSADGLAALLGAFPEREYYGQAFGLEHTIQKGVVPHSEHDTHIFVAKKTT